MTDYTRVSPSHILESLETEIVETAALVKVYPTNGWEERARHVAASSLIEALIKCRALYAKAPPLGEALSLDDDAELANRRSDSWCREARSVAESVLSLRARILDAEEETPAQWWETRGHKAAPVSQDTVWNILTAVYRCDREIPDGEM